MKVSYNSQPNGEATNNVNRRSVSADDQRRLSNIGQLQANVWPKAMHTVFRVSVTVDAVEMISQGKIAR